MLGDCCSTGACPSATHGMRLEHHGRIRKNIALEIRCQCSRSIGKRTA